MSLGKPSTPTKLCPTCGTRISIEATRCIVCGSDLSGAELKKPARSQKGVEGSRLPVITLSLPAVLGLFALFLIIGAVLVYFAMAQAQGIGLAATETPTVTLTMTPSLTPTPITPTPTDTPLPSPTPFVYTVKLGDTCLSIAIAFKVSIPSIVLLNNLPADCGTLYENQKLLIPHPTPTVTPPATATLSAEEATEAACEKYAYVVQENDTLSSISFNFQVPAEEISKYNGLVNNIVRFGQTLQIPLCKRFATPGPTPTPTLPPPYPAVNLLLPPDGAAFNPASGSITLQWASVGTLRSGEAYAVTLEDVTGGEGRKLVEYVLENKFIVPDKFLPSDAIPHVIRWWVLTVRQMGTDEDGNPIWETAGAASIPRVFVWYGAILQTTPSP